jgi:hypothetical protein
LKLEKALYFHHRVAMMAEPQANLFCAMLTGDSDMPTAIS